MYPAGRAAGEQFTVGKQACVETGDKAESKDRCPPEGANAEPTDTGLRARASGAFVPGVRALYCYYLIDCFSAGEMSQF